MIFCTPLMANCPDWVFDSLENGAYEFREESKGFPAGHTRRWVSDFLDAIPSRDGSPNRNQDSPSPGEAPRILIRMVSLGKPQAQELWTGFFSLSIGTWGANEAGGSRFSPCWDLWSLNTATLTNLARDWSAMTRQLTHEFTQGAQNDSQPSPRRLSHCPIPGYCP